MICFEDKLDSAINGLCPTILGMENNGYLLLRSDVANRSITDFVASFIPTSPAIPVYHPLNDLAYKPKSEGTTNGYGLTKFEKSIELFILANTELSQTQLMQLKNNNAEWVFVGILKDGQIVVFGFERGLKLKTSMQEFNSLDTHGGIVLTFDETAVNTPMLFSNALSISYFDMDMIYGGTIANGGALRLFVDEDKTGYILLPNGTILTTASGIINTFYFGVGGSITYYVPKNVLYPSIEESGITGNITFTGENELLAFNNTGITGVTADKVSGITTSNNTNMSYLHCSLAEDILVYNCDALITFDAQNADMIGATNSENLANITAPKAVTLQCGNCALTYKSIGDILYQAYIDNRANVVYDFSGGTNAVYDEVQSYLSATYNVDLLDILDTLNAVGGDITYNSI